MQETPISEPRFGFDGRYLVAAWREMLSLKTLSADLMAGVVVAVVALPLCIAFAVAAGVPPAVGLVTGVVGGVLAGLFGGSRFSVTGPAAAMAVLLIGVTERFGVGGLLTAGFVCGALQVVTGFFKLGRLAQYIPVPVVSGFTSGIGILIINMQLPGLLGVPRPPAGVSPFGHYAAQLPAVNRADVLIALATVLAMVLVPRKGKVPGALVAVVAGTLVSLALPAVLSGAAVTRVGDIPRMLPSPGLWDVPWDRLGELLVPALAVFALASIESLLCAVACDAQSGSRHRGDQELIGQGLANLVVPFFGGIPVTGVIVRSSAGIRAGARTRLAAVAHALVLLLLMVALADVAALIPRAALAGILLVTGYRMFEWEVMVRTLRASRLEGAVLTATLLVTVVTDLIVGVAAGFGLAVAVFALKAARRFSLTGRPGDARGAARRVVVHEVAGPLFFGAAPRFVAALEAGDGRDVAVLDLARAWTLDTTACEAIAHLAATRRRHGSALVLGGVGPHRRLLRRSGALEAVGEANVFLELADARARAAELAGQAPPPREQRRVA